MTDIAFFNGETTWLRLDEQYAPFNDKRVRMIKVIWHDGQGACLFTKKLERGRFIWPSAADGTVVITPAQLGYLLEGIDWRMPQKTWQPTSAGWAKTLE